MPQKATVATVSLGYAGGPRTIERNLADVQDALDAASAGGADLIWCPLKKARRVVVGALGLGLCLWVAVV